MATVTVRADASSRFAKGNRWGWFPSAALAWRMSEEDFLKDVEWLDNLKLRLSYGITGNNNVGDYATSYYTSGPSYAVIGGNEFQGYYGNGIIDQADVGENQGIQLRCGLCSIAEPDQYNGRCLSPPCRRTNHESTVPLETGESSLTTNIALFRTPVLSWASTSELYATRTYMGCQCSIRTQLE